MQRLEVSGAVRPLWWSLGVKELNYKWGIFYHPSAKDVPICTVPS